MDGRVQSRLCASSCTHWGVHPVSLLHGSPGLLQVTMQGMGGEHVQLHAASSALEGVPSHWCRFFDVGKARHMP